MSIRTITFELEAKLKATAGGLFFKPRGKVERKSYGDATERLKVKVSNLKVPDGSEAIVTVDGEEIARIEVMGGRGRFDEESRDPAMIPELQRGQTIEVSVGGEVLLRGNLYVD